MRRFLRIAEFEANLFILPRIHNLISDTARTGGQKRIGIVPLPDQQNLGVDGGVRFCDAEHRRRVNEYGKKQTKKR